PRLIPNAYHSGENSFKPLTETLQIKRLLKTRNLDTRVPVQEDFVNISRVRLCVRETDAEGLGINPCQSADDGLSLRCQDANVLLEEIRQFFHEFPARGRRQLFQHP